MTTSRHAFCFISPTAASTLALLSELGNPPVLTTVEIDALLAGLEGDVLCAANLLVGRTTAEQPSARARELTQALQDWAASNKRPIAS